MDELVIENSADDEALVKAEALKEEAAAEAEKAEKKKDDRSNHHHGFGAPFGMANGIGYNLHL